MKKHLDKYQGDHITRCSLCGLCEQDCPSLDLTGISSDGPRGKMALLRALVVGKIKESEIAAALRHCASCGKCTNACPEGLPIGLILQAGRFDTCKKTARNLWRTRLHKALLPYPRIFNAIQPILALALRIQKKRRGFALPLELRPTVRPKITQDNQRPTVFLFSGCLGLRVYTGISNAARRALDYHGYNALMPKDEACCGRPFMAVGEISATLACVRHNLAMLRNRKFECLVTPCPCCLDSIQKIWPAQEGLSKEERKFCEKLAAKAMDINAFLAPQAMDLPEQPPQKSSLVWHRPCLQNDKAASGAKTLLESAHWKIKYIEADPCCGGSMNVFCLPGFGKDNPETGTLAVKAGRLLRDAIMAAGEGAVTGCPWCMLSLDRAFARANDPLGPAHSIELYATALPEKNCMGN